MRAPEVRISWRTAAVDVPGIVATGGVNVVLVLISALAVIAQNRASWFTVQRWRLHRGPESISGILLIALTLSLVAWGWAWRQSDMNSWRWQNRLAVWCWALTAFHVVGCVSLHV